MTRINIGPETETREYKKSTGEMKEAMLSIAAILNKHQKGKLYFGVKNDGTVIGQEITDETLRKVSQAIGNHITPTIYPIVEEESYGDKRCIKVTFEGGRCPYLAYNVPRIRVADEDLVMEQDVYEEMMRKRDDIKYAWEQQVSEYTIADVDEASFREYLRKAKEAGRIEFEETDIDTITTIVNRYYDQDTWKADLIFEKESFELLQDILDSAGELSTRAPYKDLVNTEFAKKALK